MVATPKPVLTSRRIALGVLALGAVGVSGAAITVYLQREAIGVRLAFDYLRAHGVPADIRLDRLDLGGASGAVRLGPKGRPDLTVGRVEAQFGALPAPWRGVRAPPVKSLTLTRPVLHARWVDGRLDFGSLQPLIDQALTAKGGAGGPQPDLYVHDGQLQLQTPAGLLVVALDAAVQGGRVRSLHARLEPSELSTLGVRVADVQGVLSGQATGLGALHLTGAFSAARGQGVGTAKGAASGLTLTVEALAPNGAGRPDDAAERPLDATLRLQATRFLLQPRQGAPWRVQNGELTLDLDGQVDRQDAFAGRLHAAGRAARLAQGQVELAAAVLDLQSAAARARAGPHGVEADGPFALALSSGGGSARLGRTAVSLAPARLQASGRLATGRDLRLQAAGAFQGGTVMTPTDAVALARQAVGGVDPPSAAPLARALQRVRLEVPAYSLDYDARRGAVLRLDRGAQARVEGGALSLRPLGRAPLLQTTSRGAMSGALALALQVRDLPYVALEAPRFELGAGGAVRAQASLAVEGGFGPADDATLHLAGAVAGEGGRWTLTSAGCARLTASALRSGGKVVATGVQGEACPDGAAPLLSLDQKGWRVRAQARDIALTLPQGLRAQVAGAGVALDGGGAGLAGQVLVHGAAAQDIEAVPRVKPLTATGALTFAGQEVRGRLAIALAKGDVPLGVVDVDALTRRGAGQATLDTGRLRFAADGLQPGDIVPAAAHIAPQADGEVQLIGRFAWTPGGVTSSGEVSTGGLSFRSAAGRLDGVRGDIRLASLTPLVSEAGQTVTADKLETAIPLTALKAAFSLQPDSLQLQRASAQVAGGAVSLDPMRLPLTPGGGTAGVLRLRGVDLQQLIAALNLANSVKLQARVDGQLPFALQPAPGGATVLRLAQGRVYAEAPGRLTIARQALSGAVATAGAAGAQPNAVQDFAYQALEDLAFTTLDAEVASRGGGRLGVVFHVVGRHDPKVDRPTRIGVLALLRGHAFDKPLPLPKGTPVDLTLDTSLNLDDILNAYTHLGGTSGSGAVHP